MIVGSPEPSTPAAIVVPVPSKNVNNPCCVSVGPYVPPDPARILVLVSVSRASTLIVLPVIETVAAPVDVKLIAPEVLVPPGALSVVIVLLSTTCPDTVNLSPTLSRNKDTVFDPAGTDAGTPTAKVTSSLTPAPKLPAEVKRIIFSDDDKPS